VTALILLAVLLLAVVLVLWLVGAGITNFVEAVFDQAGGAFARRGRRRASFTTSLRAADVRAAVSEAAAMLPGARVGAEPAVGRQVVLLPSGGGVVISVAMSGDGLTRVRLNPDGPEVQDDALARFHGCMLAALRARDPQSLSR